MSDLRTRLSAILRGRSAASPAGAEGDGAREARGGDAEISEGSPGGTLGAGAGGGARTTEGAGAARPLGSIAPAEVLRPRSRRRAGRIEEILPGEEVLLPSGPCWLGRWSLEERILDAAGLADAFAAPEASTAERGSAPSDSARPTDPPPGRVSAPTLLLDLETTGFAGVPLFLAGIIETGSGKVEQFFARDYSEEAAVVEAVAQRMARAVTLVTFNGKSYDVPFLKDRAACHKVTLPQPGEHHDLLYAARRRWRGVLPDCRLTTIEAHLGGRPRVGDVPGAEIPARYHDAVRRGDPSGLAGVFLHNARDLVTLARLYLSLREDEAERP